MKRNRNTDESHLIKCVAETERFMHEAQMLNVKFDIDFEIELKQCIADTKNLIADIRLIRKCL